MEYKTIKANLKKESKRLIPSYFSLVMATGIVSIAGDLMGLPLLGRILFYVNTAAYLLLWIFLIYRLIYYLPKVRKDFYKDARSPGFLTLVASTCILGNQFSIFQGNYAIAGLLYYFGLFLWGGLIYTLFAIIITKRGKPSLGEGMNGMWLLIVVSAESLSILGSALAEHLRFPKELILLNSLFLFLLGSLFYIILITLIFYRLTFFKLRAKDFLPAYWINMGAVAILTLAGADLLEHIGNWEVLHSTLEFLKGYTFLFWVMGSWWIPLIIILDIWRYYFNPIPLRYQPQQWGMVFPLGMYAVCTYRLAQAMDIPLLFNISNTFLYIAIGVWALVMFGLGQKIKTDIFEW